MWEEGGDTQQRMHAAPRRSEAVDKTLLGCVWARMHGTQLRHTTTHRPANMCTPYSPSIVDSGSAHTDAEEQRLGAAEMKFVNRCAPAMLHEGHP